MKVLSADFVTSATRLSEIPREARTQVAFVGRSNVGKSSLINALVRARVARISAAPGKTTFLNLYRVRLAGAPVASPDGEPTAGRTRSRTIYLVDLPGYGYARGGARSARAFDRLTRAYFGAGHSDGGTRGAPADRPPTASGAVLAIDARHPGLAKDLEALEWLTATGLPLIVVATKFDQVAPSRRPNTRRELERAMGRPVLPVSAVSGIGLRMLWEALVRLCDGAEPRH